jgi:signal transduction histidine kinase
MFSSLQSRLLLAVGVMALAAVAAVALAVRQGARQEFLRFQEVERRTASLHVPELAGVLAPDLDGQCCEGGTLEAAAARLPADSAALVVRAGDWALVASAGASLRGVRLLRTRRDGPGLMIEAVREAGPNLTHIGLTLQQSGTPIRLAGGRDAMLFVIPFPGQDRARVSTAFLGSLDRRLLVTSGLVALAALLLTWLVARGIAGPLRELQSATRDLARGELSRRVAPRGGTEVADLARSFNSMAAELEREHGLRRDLVHDVAHELRTPLTAARCRLEAMLDGLAPDPARALAQVREEVLHLGRLVDDLQELALAEARELRLETRDVALRDVIESAVRAARLEAGARLRLEVPDGVVAHADPVRVRQVVLNLLTNADRYAPPDAAIVVRCSSTDREAMVEVENGGSRLDDDQLRRLFDRFYRTDPSRQRVTGGSGLGLAIVKHLVEAQGGRVWARSNDSSVTVGFSLPKNDLGSLYGFEAFLNDGFVIASVNRGGNR